MWAPGKIRYAATIVIGLVLVLQVALKRTDVENDADLTPRRSLQFFGGFTSAAESIFPFFRPNQYLLQPPSSFFRFFACTDIYGPGCDATNTIVFTATENPPPNGFRYHNAGPPELQGVFWTQQNVLPSLFATFGVILEDPPFFSTELVSFARTRHGGGVQEGVLQTNRDGYEFVARPVGDHSWSTTENAPDTYVSASDPLYQFDLTEGTLTSPRRFEIVISFKVLFDCMRYNFGNMVSSITKLEQILITDPNDEYRRMYPGSVVWKRRTTYVNLIELEYLSVQVVDGRGQTILPAWSEFQRTTPVIQIYGLDPRLINTQILC